MLGLKKLIHVEQNLAFFAKFQRNFLSKCQQKNKGYPIIEFLLRSSQSYILNSSIFQNDFTND